MKILEKLGIGLIHLIFLGLIVLSALLYKERFFADGAYYFFHAINSSWFHIEADRITIALSQLFPLIASWLGFPLKYLMVISSVGHELFHYLIFLLVVYKLKNKAAGLAIILLHVIGQLWLFYVPMLEIGYGGTLAILFYALLSSDKWRDDKWLLLLLMAEWLVLFSHPENLFLIPLLLIVDFLNRGFQQRIHAIAASLFVIGILVKALNFSAYDLQKLSSSAKPSTHQLNLSYFQSVFEVFTTYYIDLVLMAAVIIVFLLLKRKIKRLLLFILSLVALIFIINKIEDTSTFYWYSEVVNTPIVFLVVFFFTFEFWARLSRNAKQIGLLAIVVLAVFRISWTYSYGKPMRERAEQLDRLVDYTQLKNGSKFVIDENNFAKPYTQLTWASPIESLLFSAIDGKEQTVSIISKTDLDYERNQSKLNDSTFVFRKFDLESLDFLNPAYFKLNKEKYQPLNASTFDLPIERFKNQLSISLLNQTPQVINDTVYLRVAIQNDYSEPLPSRLDEHIFISYHWLQNNEVVSWDGIRTAIELDVNGHYEQDILVAMPEEAGAYQFQPDVVVEGKAWFNLKKTYEIEVVNP